MSGGAVALGAIAAGVAEGKRPFAVGFAGRDTWAGLPAGLLLLADARRSGER